MSSTTQTQPLLLSYRLQEPTLTTEDPKYLSLLLYSILALLIYTVAVPVLAAAFLHKNKAKLRDEKFLASYGFLYAGYKQNRYLWELLLVLPRKVAVAAIATVVADPVEQSVMMYGVLCVSLLLQLTFNPFESTFVNRLEAMGLSILVATQVAGEILVNVVA